MLFKWHMMILINKIELLLFNYFLTWVKYLVNNFANNLLDLNSYHLDKTPALKSESKLLCIYLLFLNLYQNNFLQDYLHFITVSHLMALIGLSEKLVF